MSIIRILHVTFIGLFRRFILKSMRSNWDNWYENDCSMNRSPGDFTRNLWWSCTRLSAASDPWTALTRCCTHRIGTPMWSYCDGPVQWIVSRLQYDAHDELFGYSFYLISNTKEHLPYSKTCFYTTTCFPRPCPKWLGKTHGSVGNGT